MRIFICKKNLRGGGDFCCLMCKMCAQSKLEVGEQPPECRPYSGFILLGEIPANCPNLSQIFFASKNFTIDGVFHPHPTKHANTHTCVFACLWGLENSINRENVLVFPCWWNTPSIVKFSVAKKIWDKLGQFAEISPCEINSALPPPA